MIRFVDLRGQGIGRIFTFWDTSIDKIIEYNDNSHWNNWEEFKNDFIKHFGAEAQLTIEGTKRLQRFKSLCPSWVFEVDDAITTENFEFPSDTVCLAELLDTASQICEKFSYDYDDLEVTSSLQKHNNIIVRVKRPTEKGI